MVLEMDKVNPDFVVVGAVKAGTTSLHHYFNQHSGIHLSPIKETNFFSRYDMTPENFRKDYSHDIALDIEKYLAADQLSYKHIAHINNLEHYKALYREVPKNSLTGEVCNSYLICPNTAKNLYEHHPNVKIIAVLRNPIDRVFSQYLMNLKEGKTLEKDFLKELKDDLNTQPKGWGVSHQYHEVGLYYQQLNRYFHVFDPKQIKVVFFEDLKQNPVQFLEELFRFLGLPSEQIDTTQKLNASGKARFEKLNYLLTQTGVIRGLKAVIPRSARQHLARVVYTQKGLPTLSHEARTYLTEYYREDVHQLEALLNVNLKHWLTK